MCTINILCRRVCVCVCRSRIRVPVSDQMKMPTNEIRMNLCCVHIRPVNCDGKCVVCRHMRFSNIRTGNKNMSHHSVMMTSMRERRIPIPSINLTGSVHVCLLVAVVCVDIVSNNRKIQNREPYYICFVFSSLSLCFVGILIASLACTLWWAASDPLCVLAFHCSNICDFVRNGQRQ